MSFLENAPASAPRHVAVVTDAWFPQVNGVVRTLDNVRRILDESGVRMSIVHPGDFTTVPLPRYPEIRLSVMPYAKVAAGLDRLAPDAIHIATEGSLGLAALRYCRRRGFPFTTSYHTQFPLYLQQYAKVPPRVGFAMLRRWHNTSERTLVPTPSMLRDLEKRGFTNLVQWTRGVDHQLFRPRPGAYLDGEAPILLYAGRVAMEKNLRAFLDAPVSGTKYVVGDGPALSQLRADHPDVRFTGYKFGEELAEHMAAADAFVFPSLTDTFGIVMLEAMASGVPVAAFPVTGPGDIVRDGVTGGIDHDLPRAIARALACDPLDCQSSALTFSWRRCAEIFLEALAPIERTHTSSASRTYVL